MFLLLPFVYRQLYLLQHHLLIILWPKWTLFSWILARWWKQLHLPPAFFPLPEQLLLLFLLLHSFYLFVQKLLFFLKLFAFLLFPFYVLLEQLFSGLPFLYFCLKFLFFVYHDLFGLLQGSCLLVEFLHYFGLFFLEMVEKHFERLIFPLNVERLFANRFDLLDQFESAQ